MYAYFARRFLLIIPTFFGVTLLVFMITRIVPGGPVERTIMQWRQAQAGGEGGAGAGSRVVDPTSEIPQSVLEELNRQFHYDKPAWQAYGIWLYEVVVHQDLGKSFYYHEPVTTMIVDRFPISLTFGLTGFVLSYLVCVPLGVFKALKHGSAFDVGSSFLVFIGYSVPGWTLGAMLLLFLASGAYWEVFPLGGVSSTNYNQLPRIVQAMEPFDAVVDEYGDLDREQMSWLSRGLDRFQYMFLPVLCYMVGNFAVLTVLMKNSLMDNLGQDYVRTAFAKGLAPNRVIFLHTLRNSLIPLATGLGNALGLIMAGSYLIELVFNIDGLGYLGFQAIQQRDYALVLGVLVINTLLLLVGNILSDVLYALIDPRIRFE